MFDYREYYKKENDQVLKSYKAALGQVESMVVETEGKDGYGDYFYKLGEFILMVAGHEEAISQPDFYTEQPFEVLKELNKGLYEDILPDNYDSSYGNPAYAVAKFGKEIGQVLTALYGFVRDLVPSAYEHKLFDMAHTIELVNKCYTYVKDAENVQVDTLIAFIVEDKKSTC